VQDIVNRLKMLESVGMEQVTVQPAGPDISQLELIAEKILPHFV
jgi:hypothetical protein